LKDPDDVSYEICNEPFNDGMDAGAVIEWHKHMAARIVRQEHTLGVRHLVAANEAVHDDSNIAVMNWHNVASFPKSMGQYGLNKPISLDETDGSLVHASVDDVRVEAREWICGGGARYDNLSWDFTPGDPTADAGRAIRRQLKVSRDFVSKLNVIGMKPQPAVIVGPQAAGVSARAIVEPGDAYWVYLHDSAFKRYGTFMAGYNAQKGLDCETLELAIPRSAYTVQSIRPRDGRSWAQSG
jgi:hypothetical protein